MSDWRSDDIAAIAEALAAAQGAMRHAVKGATNPHFRSRYADLADVYDAVREPLAAHGLAVVQLVGYTDAGLAEVSTVLTHTSGQYLRSVLAVPLKAADAQALGSALTYARRYALAAICGVAQDDDDGNGASNREREEPRQQHREESQQQPAAVTATPDTIRRRVRAGIADLAKAGTTAEAGPHILAIIGDLAKCKAGGETHAAAMAAIIDAATRIAPDATAQDLEWWFKRGANLRNGKYFRNGEAGKLAAPLNAREEDLKRFASDGAGDPFDDAAPSDLAE